MNYSDAVRLAKEGKSFIDIVCQDFKEADERAAKRPRLIEQPKPENWNITEVQKTLNYIVYRVLQDIY
jgi:hypothetical protein